MATSADWHVRVVASLQVSKRQFVPFDLAWRAAMRAAPPKSSVDQDISGWFEERCREAWHNEKPKLAHFNTGILMGLDLSENARHAGAPLERGSVVAA